jgi:tRNA modification GTPase
VDALAPLVPTASVLTPTGRGAVASIRVLGEPQKLVATIDRFFKAANNKSFSQQIAGRICFGRWQSSAASDSTTSDEVEEVVVCRISDSHAEVNCHGGRAAVDRILEMLGAAGFDLNREFGASDHSAISVECYLALSLATTRRTVEHILRQLPDRLEQAVLQFVDSIDQAISQPSKKKELITASREQLAQILKWSEFGLHLSRPWRVALVGRPNVGKSTLINALLGYERAIVFAEPGTTRDVVVGQTAFDGWPVQLADTAGIRQTENELESAGIEKSQHEILESDCVCLLLDTSTALTQEDLTLLSQTARCVEASKLIIVLNKQDLPARWSKAELAEEFQERCFVVSSTERVGVDVLIAEISAVLVPQLPDAHAILPLVPRQVGCLKRAHESINLEDAQLQTSRAELIELLQPTK